MWIYRMNGLNRKNKSMLLRMHCNIIRDQLQSFQNCFTKKIVKKGKSDISWGPGIVGVVPPHARSFGRRFCLVKDALKGVIPEYLDVFSCTMSQRHGYNTRNGHMSKVSRPRTECGRIKTGAINDWTLLPSELKRLIPQTILN